MRIKVDYNDDHSPISEFEIINDSSIVIAGDTVFLDEIKNISYNIFSSRIGGYLMLSGGIATLLGYLMINPSSIFYTYSVPFAAAGVATFGVGLIFLLKNKNYHSYSCTYSIE